MLGRHLVASPDRLKLPPPRLLPPKMLLPPELRPPKLLPPPKLLLMLLRAPKALPPTLPPERAATAGPTEVTAWKDRGVRINSSTQSCGNRTRYMRAIPGRGIGLQLQ